jgi:hypothetical protein
VSLEKQCSGCMWFRNDICHSMSFWNHKFPRLAVTDPGHDDVLYTTRVRHIVLFPSMGHGSAVTANLDNPSSVDYWS